MPHALVLGAHPDLARSHVNRALAEACRGVPGVAYRDLYALYPDYLIDVPAEQAALAEARLVVWQHPIQWYSMPPLMKLWVDEVLRLGWAYGAGGTALRGKDLWLVASTGSPEEAYRPGGRQRDQADPALPGGLTSTGGGGNAAWGRYSFDAFLPPYEQTATLCGMRFLPPMLLHGAHRVSDAALAGHVQTFVDRLRRYPDWPELQHLPECPAREVAPGERPEPR
ncbi:MAG: NAD(P)H-dependent oxidoreductase [Pseudomonadota bacterium]